MGTASETLRVFFILAFVATVNSYSAACFTLYRAKDLSHLCQTSVIKNKTLVSCSFKNHGKCLNMSDLVQWTSAQHYGKFDLPIHLSINCNTAADLFLPKHIWSNGIHELSIRNCYIREYFSVDALLDGHAKNGKNISSIYLENNIIELSFNYLYKIIKHKDVLFRDYYLCEFPPDIRSYIERNCSYVLANNILEYNATIIKEFQHVRLQKPTCVYSKMEYLERTHIYSGNSEDTVAYFNYMLAESRFPKLHTLNISWNVLRSMPEFYKHAYGPNNLPSLRFIDLSYNSISNFQLWPYNGQDLTINLFHNNITIIDQDAIQEIKTFFPAFVNISKNPFYCTCEQQTFIDFIKTPAPKLSRMYHYLADERCYDTISYLHERLADVQMHCQKNENLNKIIHIILTVVAFCLFLGIGTLGFIRYKKRFSFGSSVVYTSVKDDPDKIYDAFVSYSSKDVEKALEFCKTLESHSIKTCIHHRDFIPGEFIPRNIAESVAKSRHTILLLTENFLDSQWCLFEFQKAFEESILHSKCHLILVFLEQVDISQHKDIACCLTSYTYLNMKDQHFWSKLLRALRKNVLVTSSNAGEIV